MLNRWPCQCQGQHRARKRPSRARQLPVTALAVLATISPDSVSLELKSGRKGDVDPFDREKLCQSPINFDCFGWTQCYSMVSISVQKATSITTFGPMSRHRPEFSSHRHLTGINTSESERSSATRVPVSAIQKEQQGTEIHSWQSCRERPTKPLVIIVMSGPRLSTVVRI